MMLLSSPELKPHMAPAIDGAFVGVERTAMSYYELVKLFDNKGRCAVFHAYIGGEGKNAFIYMFTMRLTKLLHRLCTCYQSLMLLLSSPELKPHMAPAIVGAFAGVERAIMNYSDLDHRYRYELRIPIMNLMVKLFEDKGRRDPLHAYICGEGKNAFIDMFTMMTKDANSIIAAVITSRKKFRASSTMFGSSAWMGRELLSFSRKS
eukprot:TRINITY_DN8827_c0_g1_i1.p1 TRINITY_DN8827_c0_g1~~TRINITY_DN8827_c0_g1_i1.p1  ORF type:complete len:206 (-),score=28.84 TRINITY_DN8827_c0_g1_i1:272-889(-)